MTKSVIAEVSLSGGQVTTYQAPFPDSTVANYSLGGRKLLLGSMWHTDDGRPILTQRDTGRLDGPFQQVADFDCSGYDADDVAGRLSWCPGTSVSQTQR